jgi:membrane fusion protein (multidrug efflux system)
MSEPSPSNTESSAPAPAGQQESMREKAQKSRFKSLAIIGAVFLVLAIIGGIYWMTHASLQDTDNATIVGHLHPVSARIPGTVQQVLVDDNELVKAGQVIAMLDPTDYKLALSQAQHNLELAKSQALTAQKNIGFAERQANSQIQQAAGGLNASRSAVLQSKQAKEEAYAAVETARQNLAQQNANYQHAAADYHRYASLDADAVSGQQLDVAKTALEVAKAAQGAAQASLAQAQARAGQLSAAIGENVSRVAQSKGTYQGAESQTLQVDVVRSQYENALAQVKVAADQLKVAQTNLSYTVIKAPADGLIGRKTVELGQRVQVGEPLLSIVSKDLWVVANFKETQLENMKLGHPADLEVDSFPHHHFKGWINSFSPASGAEFALLPPENATGNFTKIVQRIPVKIAFDPESTRGYENRLAPGMSVVVTIDTADKEPLAKKRTTTTITTHSERHD